MKFTHLFLAATLFLTTHMYAQTGRHLSGVIKDSMGVAIPWATVKLFTGKDSLVVAANGDGRYTLSSVTVNQFSLMVSSIGYQEVKKQYTLIPGTTAAELEPIIMKSDAFILKGITVIGSIAVKMKEDTVEYNASAYKVREGAVIEDALKKMPGLEVGKDGSISMQGKQVSKVQLNGKDYMAGDVKSLTRNLPADLVQNVQVIDDHGDQSRLTGIKTGEAQKVLNINIRKDKNHGYVAQGTVGGGRDAVPGDRSTKNTGRYAVSTNVFNFDGKRQITLSGDLNNTNTSLFDFSGGGGSEKGPPNLFGDKQNGMTATRSLGFNYRDDWDENLAVYGSYSVADNSVNAISTTVQQNLSEQLPSVQISNSNKNERNLNHRANLNVEYKPDTLNYFKFTPTFSYGAVYTDESFASRLQARNAGSVLISDYIGSLQAHTSSRNFGASALFNHRFHKRGRNFSALLTNGTTTSEQYENPIYNYLVGKVNAPVNQMINNDSRTDSTGVALSYLEPLGKQSYLEINYNFHNAGTTTSRLTDTVTATGEVKQAPELSNDYKFNFMINRFGVNYYVTEKKYNFTLGLTGQPTLLKGSSSSIIAGTHKTTFNFSPVLRYIYNFSDLQALVFNFTGGSTSPAYYQLQPVIDFSNATYPVQGNPALLPEYNNTLQIRYNKFGDGTGKTFFTTLNFTQTNHKIVANTVIYPGNYTDPRLSGTILTKYLNASGFYDASANYVLAGAWAKRKYTWLLNGNIAYNNNISYLTDVLDSLGMNQTIQKNIAKNLVLAQGAHLRVDIADIVDAEVHANYLINHSGNYIINTNVNNNFQTITLGTNGKLYFLKHWTLSYTYNKVINKGYQGATNPNLLDAYIEMHFLKKNIANIRFSIYDLFHENTGLTLMQNAHAITQSNVNRLGRYFLLTFTLKLQKFAGKAPEGAPGTDNGG